MPAQYTTRYLGFEIEPAGGAYRISHIYRDGPADKEWLGLKVGDTVLAIDGKSVRPPENYLAGAQRPAERVRDGEGRVRGRSQGDA